MCAQEAPAVRDAAVFGMPDAVLGERVAGLVQLTENASPTARDDIIAGVYGPRKMKLEEC